MFNHEVDIILPHFHLSIHDCLLGHIDLDTQEWTVGMLTFNACQVVNEAPKVISWITCDGDTDPGWIESLNSVLSRKKGHSGWYWVVIRITHYVCQREVKRRQCASV